MSGRWSRIRKFAVRGLLGLVVLLGLFVGVRWWTGNLGVIHPGTFYRSGQLTARGLSRTIERVGVRTVLNLRGSNPDEPWYRAERAATLAAGATQIDVAMASNLWLSRDQALMLVEVLETCETPVLVHCQWGAERTGLVAAMIELLRDGGSLESAHAQFRPFYLFLPIKDGLVMQAHLDRYEAYLASTGLSHSPRVFRHWITEIYEPGSPSREEWPYDPYPLALITRPPEPRLAVRPGSKNRLSSPSNEAVSSQRVR